MGVKLEPKQVVSAWLSISNLATISPPHPPNCRRKALQPFSYCLVPTMITSPIGSGLTPEGTEPPPPPDPDEGHSETIGKRYSCAKVTLPTSFHLKPSSSSSLLITKTQVQNPTSILRRLSVTSDFLSHQPSLTAQLPTTMPCLIMPCLVISMEPCSVRSFI
jgi:hypothetical protein